MMARNSKHFYATTGTGTVDISFYRNYDTVVSSHTLVDYSMASRLPGAGYVALAYPFLHRSRVAQSAK